jgi:hypothetical protein
MNVKKIWQIWCSRCGIRDTQDGDGRRKDEAIGTWRYAGWQIGKASTYCPSCRSLRKAKR